MSRVLTDTGRRVGCYIVDEGDGATGPHFSRDNVTLLTGAEYVPGMVLGKVTASGKYAPLNEAGADGTEAVAGICYGFYDATDADVKGVATVRRAAVNGHELVWPGTYDAANIAAAEAALAELGIVVRY